MKIYFILLVSVFLCGCGGGGGSSDVNSSATTAKIINNSDSSISSMIIILEANTNTPSSFQLEIIPPLNPGQIKILDIDGQFCDVSLFIKSNITAFDSAAVDEVIACGTSNFECQVTGPADLLVDRYFTSCSKTPIAVAPVVSNVSAEGDLVVMQGNVATLGVTGILGTGTGVTYFWSILQRPTGSVSFLINERSEEVSFLADINGFYNLKLEATDTNGNNQDYLFSVFSVPVGSFSLGSNKDGVKSAQGNPDSIDTTLFGYFDYNYGLDSIRFSTESEKVISWGNSNGILNPVIAFGDGSSLIISVGSSQDDVARLQGVPTEIRLTLFGYYEWFYGLSSIRFSDDEGVVISFDNSGGNLIL